MSQHAMTADLAAMAGFARELADAARGETLPRWSAGCAADNKTPDKGYDPVTEADRGAERVMRAMIEDRFPNHGVFGEEFPDREPQGRYSWSLDPVDGTRSFICRLPTWTTLIALLSDGKPVLGLIDAPCLDERYLGFGPGLMQTVGLETALRTSNCTRIEEARVSTTDPYMLSDIGNEGWDRVQRQARTTRYGHDGYGYARLAAGSIDLVIETGLKSHDYNALIPVVRSAGGVIGDWSGGEDFSSGSIIAAATPQLFEAAVAAMR